LFDEHAPHQSRGMAPTAPADAVALSSVCEMAMWTFVEADATVPSTEGA
jgi:hypothetical protein